METEITLRHLKQQDLSAADKLREAAGWNQTLADWKRLLALDPEGCFAAVQTGQVVGTATTTSFGTDLAWIGMVLVDPAQRNKGIGRKLLLHCLEYLRVKGIRCIKLDATPAGQILYEKLGFRVEWPLARWVRREGELPKRSMSTSSVVPASQADWNAIEELDRKAIGVGRAKFLRSLSGDSTKTVVCREKDGEGFGFLRKGINADYIGPVVAQTESAGKKITLHLLQTTPRPVFWDIPEPCTKASAWASELGFVQQRPLLRMHLGENNNAGSPEMLWGISDPATG